MNNFIKQVIEEKFASKAQQRFFYAKANEKGKPKKEKKKWSKWAKEFSDDTDFKEIPDKVEKEEEVDEIVDAAGNFAKSKKPTNSRAEVTSNSTSDEVALTAAGQSSISPKLGMGFRRYWGESDMSKALGAEDTIMDDASYEEAKKKFIELGVTDPKELEDRLGQMGYDPKLPDDKVRLVENPKKFMEETMIKTWLLQSESEMITNYSYMHGDVPEYNKAHKSKSSNKNPNSVSQIETRKIIENSLVRFV